MYLLIPKIVFASGIFLLTLVTGIIPLKLAKRDSNFVDMADALASGIFLSTALLHLLPDAAEKLSAINNHAYPLAHLICIATFVVLLILERGVSIHFSNNKFVAPIFLVLLLGIHALIEGAAIGINSNILETSAIFFAVLAHKGSESFALSMNLHRYSISTTIIKKIIAVFALITPLGIFIASSIIYNSATNSTNLLQANLSALAAGTFLYLGTEHLIDCKGSCLKLREISALILGAVLMALLAIWV